MISSLRVRSVPTTVIKSTQKQQKNSILNLLLSKKKKKIYIYIYMCVCIYIYMCILFYHYFNTFTDVR